MSIKISTDFVGVKFLFEIILFAHLIVSGTNKEINKYNFKRASKLCTLKLCT